MPIFSSNRVGVSTISANENYGYSDFGRIMYECAINDNKVFNAALLRDFKEVSGIREGTMLESELVAFREFSIKEAWASLKEKLRKLWAKIKGVFRNVYAKLSVWLVRNGKAFVAMNRKYLTNKPGLKNCEIPKYRKRTSKEFSSLVEKCNSAKGINVDAAISQSASVDGENSEALRTAALKQILGDNSVSQDDIAKEMLDYFYEKESTDIKFGNLGVSLEKLFDNISGKSKAIGDLKKAERAADKSIKNVINKLDKGPTGDKKDDEASRKAYSNASKCISAYESVLTSCVKGTISAIRFGVKQDRMVCGKLIAFDSAKNESTAILETMAWLEGADDFDSQDSIDPAEASAEDVAGDPDIVININVDDED